MSKRKPDDLEEAADLEGSELGEYWHLLMSLKSYTWLMGDEFKAAFEKEFKDQEEYATTQFEIVEEEEQYTRTRRDLEFLG